MQCLLLHAFFVRIDVLIDGLAIEMMSSRPGRSTGILGEWGDESNWPRRLCSFHLASQLDHDVPPDQFTRLRPRNTEQFRTHLNLVCSRIWRYDYLSGVTKTITVIRE